MQVLESLTYIGRNRRHVGCVIENLIELAKNECEEVSAKAEKYCRQLQSTLQVHGIPLDTNFLSSNPMAVDAVAFFALLYAETALAIQRTAGHRVSFKATFSDPNPNRKRVVFEYEQADVGERAGLLALNLLASVFPELNWIDQPPDQTDNFADLFAEFQEFSRPLILPEDAQVIIDVTTRLDIPCVKLEREPYQGLTGDFRIRKNGLLKLGHSIYQHVVDGAFCIDKATHLLPLLKDRNQLFQTLTQLHVPVAHQEKEFRNIVSIRRATRLAATIGFPVVVKPGLRCHGRGISLNIQNEQELHIAVQKAQQFSRKVIVEKHIAGETFKVIVANGNIVGVVSGKVEGDLSSETHPSILRLVLDLVEKLGAGLLVVDVVTQEIGEPLHQQNGAIVDVDFAPELDRFLTAGSDLHVRAMSGFVQWLFPGNTRSRIPTVAVTGTNGKTTTCRMITSIMEGGHFNTGFASTDGIYIKNKLVEAGDKAGGGGHHRVFESRGVNLGVLETARGALAHSGFMFDWCNISVCLNVTEDHIGQFGIETVEQMAELKRSVLESARDGVVLFADDERCIAMIPYLVTPRICLVSMQCAVEELIKIPGNKGCFSIIESIDESDWLVLYDGDKRLPVIEISCIPATFGGAARFNVSNSLHAAAASYLMGMDMETIRKGLGTFEAGFENTPGRLNIYKKLPFTVILDYAHNADGFRKLSEFIDTQPVSGRKILTFGINSNNRDADIKAAMCGLAGHFDHYFCVNSLDLQGRQAHEMPTLLASGLTSAGITKSAISLVPEFDEWWRHGLDMAAPGDLLVLIPDSEEVQPIWELLESMSMR
jgi:UDP-N-acetylmuramyl tripeptide synthase